MSAYSSGSLGGGSATIVDAPPTEITGTTGTALHSPTPGSTDGTGTITLVGDCRDLTLYNATNAIAAISGTGFDVTLYPGTTFSINFPKDDGINLAPLTGVLTIDYTGAVGSTAPAIIANYRTY